MVECERHSLLGTAQPDQDVQSIGEPVAEKYSLHKVYLLHSYAKLHIAQKMNKKDFAAGVGSSTSF